MNDGDATVTVEVEVTLRGPLERFERAEAQLRELAEHRRGEKAVDQIWETLQWIQRAAQRGRTTRERVAEALEREGLS